MRVDFISPATIVACNFAIVVSKAAAAGAACITGPPPGAVENVFNILEKFRSDTKRSVSIELRTLYLT
jgi:hypothetical protein